MVVDARFAHLVLMAEAGHVVRIVSGHNLDSGKTKVKVILDPAPDVVPPQLRAPSVAALKALRKAAQACSVVDRGHKHSLGHSESHFWLSAAPAAASTPPLLRAVAQAEVARVVRPGEEVQVEQQASTPPSTTTTTTTTPASASSSTTGIGAAGKRQEMQQGRSPSEVPDGRVVNIMLTDGMLGIHTDDDLRITEFVEGSSACQHNIVMPHDAILIGDIVQAINGCSVRCRSDIRAAIASSPPGQAASFLLSGSSQPEERPSEAHAPARRPKSGKGKLLEAESPGRLPKSGDKQ